jgi:hypothetical protein
MTGKLMKIEGGFCRVDSDVYEWARHRRWKINPRGYVVNPSGRPLHRMILDLAVGDRRQGDHKNGNKLDNRRSNLRIVTYAQNRQNERPRKTYAGKAPKSKHRGVFHRPEAFMAKRPNGKPWFVKHRLDGKEHLGGSFHTEEEAAAAAVAWRKEHMPFSVN